jgi:hypothetical protein
MKARISLILLLVASALAFPFTPVAHGWGCKGHQTVALIAEKHLSPAAKQLAATLLAVDPGRKNSGTPCGTAGLDAFAAAATWADAVRIHGLDDGFHYLDIPRGASREVISSVCGTPRSCVTKAIADQTAILEDKNADPKARAAAIRYIIHLVGDLHQPLHCTTNGDRGGNCVPVGYFNSKPHPDKQSTDDLDDYRPNLHAVWDKQIVEKDMTAQSAASAQAYANLLDTAFAAEIAVWKTEGIHLEDWAWESHEHAEDISYGDLPKKVPVDAHADADVSVCSDNHRVGNRMLHKHIILGQPYQEEAGSVVEESLAMAGIRLAVVLNEVAANVH